MKDVKGYYRLLGVSQDADSDEIKRAYRERAKETHPDTGKSGDPDSFQAVQEAYGVLSDPETRADYDALCKQIDRIQRNSEKRRAAATRRRARQDQTSGAAQRRAAEQRASAPRESRPGDVPLGVDPDEPVRCVRCDSITAQPRYVVLLMVIGLLVHSLTRRFEGVYCRSCADKVAIGASAVTWILGWWSLPRGPIDAAKALVNNLVGGDKPPTRNARLLAHQATYFARRGESVVAGQIAQQANAFRRDPGLDRLIANARGHRLRDRWRVGGVAFIIQTLPVGLLIAWAAMVGTEHAWQVVQRIENTTLFSAPPPAPAEPAAQAEPEPVTPAEPAPSPPAVAAETAAPPEPEPVMIAPPPAAAPDVRYVTVRELTVYAGPGSNYQSIGKVPRFQAVTVLEGGLDTDWLRVETATGLDGFVSARQLTPGKIARMIWCAQHAGTRPESGEVLQRSASGDHSLGLTNQGSADALVKLRDATGAVALSVFMRATESAVIAGVPDGNFDVEYAAGSGFSRRCNLFVDQMRSYAFATPVSYATVRVEQFRMSRKVDLVLPQRAAAGERLRPITTEQFQR